ncbi:MAG: ATP-binding cassette domain-containing protein [Bacteroidales bacterium]|nr:ATP-binding cassette domain-containing protein [Bacteroidales bacterium]
MGPELFIKFKNVGFRFYAKEVFGNTSLQICNGQHLAVVGENASGKTTFGKALAGILPVIRGTADYYIPFEKITSVNFQSTLKLSSHENPYLQQRWNSFDSIHAPLVKDYFWPDGKINSETKKLLHEFGAEVLLNKKNIELSNGELRKIELIRAFSSDARIIIIDNAFIGLDQEGTRILKDTLNKISKSKTLVLLALETDELPDFITQTLYCRDMLVYREPIIQKTGKALKHLPVNLIPVYPALPDIMVSIEDVNINYDGQEILKSINWQIKAGEHWALIGPNGSGKTTLLSLFIGDNPQAYAQKIWLFGRQRGTGETIWDIKRKIGFISAELHQYCPRHHTVQQVLIDDIAWIYPGIDRKEILRNAGIWIKWFGIAQSFDTLFGQLSSGEQRLLLFIRTLIYPFALLIADEPCQGLDEQNVQKIKSVFHYIAKNTGASTIYVTHRHMELPESTRLVFDLSEKNKK